METLNGAPFGGNFPVRSYAEWLSLGQLFHDFTFEVSATEVKSYKQMFPPSRVGGTAAYLGPRVYRTGRHSFSRFRQPMRWS